VPVTIVSGTCDSIADHHKNAERLHRDITGSTLTLLPDVGHMVHHAEPDRIVEVINSSRQVAP
jgi:pimeloyl-ACP methyl ester carboxylesterase